MSVKSFLILVFTSLWLGDVRAQVDQNQAVSLQYHNKTLEQVLDDLEVRFGLMISYGKLPLDSTISYQYVGNIDQGLASFFKAHNLLFRRSGKRIVLRSDTPVGRPLRGRVLDGESLIPLLGASVQVLNVDPARGTSTNENGFFHFEQLKVGRYDLAIHYLGYETNQIRQVLVTSGKEQFVEIRLQPVSLAMQEIVVKDYYNPAQTINDMTTNSARSFSIEEASRFAAAISDPARMALAYAGVTGNGDDLSNEIIIRGNSSRGLLWRMEGVEIPTPSCRHGTSFSAAESMER